MTEANERGGASLRADARRNQRRILKAAARLLADDPAVSMQRIADEAEVARPTVFRRFATKDALIEAILREAIEECEAALRQAADSGGDGATVLSELIVALARIGADYPVLLVDTATGRVGASGMKDGLDAVIARGQHDGSVRSDLPASLLRNTVLGSLATTLRAARREGQSPTDVAVQLAELLTEGARPRR